MVANVNLYTGNHQRRDGIEDYLTLFEAAMRRTGVPIATSERLRGDAINIVIDEFTSAFQNDLVKQFHQRHPNGRLVFVLTEFIETKFGVQSFNHFGGLVNSACIALFNVFLRKTRDDYPPLRARDLAVLLALSPVLAVHVLVFTAKFYRHRPDKRDILGALAAVPGEFLRRHHQLFYFHMRYLGMQANLRYADGLITSHEAIYPAYVAAIERLGQDAPKNLGVAYPELDEGKIVRTLMRGKELFVEVSGSVTPYRRSWMRRIDRAVTVLGMQAIFGFTAAAPFTPSASAPRLSLAAYSLHPPQTRGWKYCSPMRLYRALHVDKNVPIITRHFRQNPIEDVCLVLTGRKTVLEMARMYDDRSALVDFITPRIRKYNEVVHARNQHMIESLVALQQSPAAQELPKLGALTEEVA